MSEKEKTEKKDTVPPIDLPFAKKVKVPPGSTMPPIDLSFAKKVKVPHSCKEFGEFDSWLNERLPTLFNRVHICLGSPCTCSPMIRSLSMYTVPKNKPPDWATPADMDEAIILISEEYVRRCKAMSSPHECTSFFCIHSRFQRAIKEVVKLAERLRQRLVGEAEALRKKLAEEEGEAALRNREMKALREKLAEKDEAAAGLRREAEALRKKVEAAQKALREKEQELEAAYRTFRNMVGIPATPQRSSDAPTPSTNDVRSGKFEPDYRPNRDIPGRDPAVTGPHTREDVAWDDHVKGVSGGDHHGEWYSG
jgi:hypothetical protein